MSKTTVSREQMEIDLENTKKEIKAYSLLVTGFRMLNELPETNGFYKTAIWKWEKSVKECSEFYEKLKALYKETYGDENKE